ncbi:MAG: hypothetical protein LBH19_13875 [Dysgonamonadaceae bacterium]|jgi:hypothetical protein|nr:hypothetical protein [Dysgonamonadaceae bacterium]
MKRLILFLAITTGMTGGIHAQVQETAGGDCKHLPLTAEISKMVELDDAQMEALNYLYIDYAATMNYAIHELQDRKECAKLVYMAKKKFNTRFMDLLSDNQKIEYVRNSSYPEIMEKAEVKVKVLQRTGKYTEQELEQSTSEIFEYLMLEKIAYICDKYNIERQKENIAQLKKYEPQSLRTANALQKAKHQGITYQNGYKW